MANDGYYVVGVTESDDFPATDGSLPKGGRDLFVARVGLDGVVLAATRIGGSGDDQATGVVVDPTGLLTVAGWTTSTDFPTAQPIQPANGGASDGLILQLGSDLAVQFATYVGGSGDDQFAGVALEKVTDAFVFGGFTTSTDFPFPTPNGPSADTTKSSQTDTDGLLVALGRDRAIRLATYHGLSGSNEIIQAVAADPAGTVSVAAGEVAVAGWSDHSQFYGRSSDPRGSGRKLFGGLLSSITGARLSSRVRGGSGDDEGLAVAYSAGLVQVAGSTTSADFPVSGNAPQKIHGGGGRDGLVVAFEMDGDFNNWATYIGGTGDDLARGLAFDPAGHLHLAGTTASADFPIGLAGTEAARQPTFGGGVTDGFMGRIRIAKTGFGAYEGFFTMLTFAGTGEEDGFLAAGFMPDMPRASLGDPHASMAAGGRRFAGSPRPAAGMSRMANSDETPEEEEALLTFFSELVGAVADIEVKAKWVPAPPTRDGETAALELTIINHGPAADSGPIDFTLKDDSEALSTHEFVFPAEYPVVRNGFNLTGVTRVLQGSPKVILVEFVARLKAEQIGLSHGSAIDLTFTGIGRLGDPDNRNNLEISVPRADIYAVGSATVSGLAFTDSNGNGQFDEGETAATGFVHIVDEGGRKATGRLNPDGSFTINGLPPGVFVIGGNALAPQIIQVRAGEVRVGVNLASTPRAGPPALSFLISRPTQFDGSSKGVYLAWTDGGISGLQLQRSPTPDGSYQNVPMATQPHFVPFEAQGGFFRLSGPGPAN